MPEPTLAGIASEALKPMSQLIDALVGPKIARLKSWSEKRDLKTRLDSSVVDVHIHNYLKRVLRRICGITSIVFPTQSLPLTSIYEPLTLVEQIGHKRNKDSVFNLKMLEADLTVMIVDSAGMGKSTFAKHLTLEIIKESTRIPIFLELRRIEESETLLEKIAKDIDENKRDVNEKLLPMLFESENYIFILDGYDELPDSYRDKIGLQISELHLNFPGNAIVLTSRPEVSLPAIPHARLFMISPLTKNQAKSLVLRYDRVADIDVGKRLIKEFDSVPERFLETPMLVALLYKTYGYNQSIETKITAFYNEIYNALYKGHDLSKAGFSRKKQSGLDTENFRRLLRGFCFLLMMEQRDNLRSESEACALIDKASKLVSIIPSTTSAFFSDLLLSVPIIVREGTDFRFIHKTLKEYFASEFLANWDQADKILINLWNSRLRLSLNSILEYLSELNPSLFLRAVLAPVASECLERVSRVKEVSFVSITYQFDFSIGVLREDDKKQFTEEKKDMIWNSGFIALSQSFVDRQGTPYVFLIGEMVEMTYSNLLPPYVYLGLSKYKEYSLPARVSTTYVVDDDIINLFINKRVPFSDETFLKIKHLPMVIDLMHELQRLTLGRKRKDKIMQRLIDANICKKVLSQVREENKANTWLEDLVNNVISEKPR